MNTELNETIKKAISDNLPGVVADELKTFIANAQKTQEQLTRSIASQETMQRQLTEANEKIAQHRTLDSKIEEIKTKEDDLLKREIQLRIDAGMNRALIAEAQLKTGMDIFSLVFRNAEISKRVLGTVPVPVDGVAPSQYNTMGSPGYAASAPTDTTETTSQK